MSGLFSIKESQPGIPVLAERVYAEIKHALFAFELLPGERFSENEIVRLTGASRTPVRDALMRLAREGFVTVQSRAGWRVNELDFAVFDQLYAIRTMIELTSIDTLITQTAPPCMDELVAIWQVAPTQRVGDGLAVFELDEQFHSTLVAATLNAELLRIYSGVTERIRIVRQLDFTDATRVEATYEEHAAIVKAIEHHRGAETKRLLQAHIETSRLKVRQISLHRLYQARDKARLA